MRPAPRPRKPKASPKCTPYRRFKSLSEPHYKVRFTWFVPGALNCSAFILCTIFRIQFGSSRVWNHLGRRSTERKSRGTQGRSASTCSCVISERQIEMADTMMDGKSLKQFVENDAEWAKFVDEKFAKLDKSHKGKLTHTDMEPAISGVGKALGMPPMGTDPETDHIYTEMFSEFGPGGEGVTKEKFSSVMRDILLGLGDGLEREPVAISPLDGSGLEKWARGSEFEVEAVAAFSVLDTNTSGQVKADAIRQAMGRVTVDHGMPPQTDASVSKYIDRAFQESGVNGQQELNQAQFVDAYRKVVLAVATYMRSTPMMVAHSDKVFDGTSISSLLKDKHALDLALGLAWEIMPKASNNQAPKSYLRVGLDTLAPYAGLPPVGAVPEMDGVVNECFKMIDGDSAGRVDREAFNKSMLEVLGGIMLQLEGKPIGVKSSAVVPPARAGSLNNGLPF